MIDSVSQNVLLLALMPFTVILCLTVNLLLRAKGRRSLVIQLKAFGVEVKMSTDASHHGCAHGESGISSKLGD